jgi:hypothetical protein
MSVTRLQDLPRIEGEPAWTPVRHLLGIASFGVNAWHGDAEGDLIIEEHDETGQQPEGGHEELYVVLTGRARFVVDGAEHDAPAGTLVFAGPEQRRVAHAAEAGTTILALGAAPGEAFAPSTWERKAVAEAGV